MLYGTKLANPLEFQYNHHISYDIPVNSIKQIGSW